MSSDFDCGDFHTTTATAATSIGQKRLRPLPSSHLLATAADGGSGDGRRRSSSSGDKGLALPPILCEFFRALGKDPPAPPLDAFEMAGNEGGMNPPAQSDPGENGVIGGRRFYAGGDDGLGLCPVPAIAAAVGSSSSLTKRQHQRFLHLSSLLLLENRPVQAWKVPEQREHRKLVQLVKKEQELYRKALSEFWSSNPGGRLALGFGVQDGSSDCSGAAAAADDDDAIAKPFVRFSLQKIQSKIEIWTSVVSSGVVPQIYGRCRQVIPCNVSDQFATLSPDDIASHVVVVERTPSEDETLSPADVEEFIPINSSLPCPVANHMALHVKLICQDETALALALQHNVDVVTTEETMESLLRMSTLDKPPSLLVPVSRTSADTFVILDTPVPRPHESTRDVLECGIEDSLSTFLKSTCQGASASPLPNRNDSMFCFTMLRFPCRTKRPLRVLVRSVRQLPRQSLYGDRPPKVRARVEYFPERGQELASSVDQATWILDHLLAGGGGGISGAAADASSVVSRPEMRVKICRVDPRTMTCLGWDDASWASATTEPFRWYEKTNPEGAAATDHWRRLASLLTATRTIGPGKHVLCLPGRRETTGHSILSVTLHECDAQGEIDLLSELGRSRRVPIGPDAFSRSQRYWRWEYADRVPFTLPVTSPKDDGQDNYLHADSN
jgi:hypothetical protein